MKPAVSVVVDTYNYERYIEDAIDSVRAQTLSGGEVEILVIDDGSADNTEGRVRRFGGTVKYIRKRNGGQASAFNVGVTVATGEVISFLDADDYFYPQKLANVVTRFDQCPEVQVLYNRYDLVDSKGAVLVRRLPKTVRVGDLALPTLLGYVSGSPASGISVRSSLARALPIPEAEFRISADHFYLSVFPFCSPIDWILEPMHAYRHHDVNAYLSRPPASRFDLLRAQHEAITNYLRLRLGKADTAMRLGYRVGPVDTKDYWVRVRWLATQRGFLALKLRTLAKWTLHFVAGAENYNRATGLRDRARRTPSL